MAGERLQNRFLIVPGAALDVRVRGEQHAGVQKPHCMP